ncbi:MAG: cell surface protein [Deltaproteobacteria bacterium]|nr:cell surface protein [Deltaproteobacteria bacterium]
MVQNHPWVAWCLAAGLAAGCEAGPAAAGPDAGGGDAKATLAALTGSGAAHPADPFADRVVAYAPGPEAGFGQPSMPAVVLGPPKGAGHLAGSLDVVSLGKNGSIVVAFDDWVATDGPGVDLLVFENPFDGFTETGEVAVSADGITWHTWPCNGNDAKGCAGVTPVYSAPGNGIAPTDPAVSGGDGFDLAVLGLQAIRYVRVRDTGVNQYLAPTGGFDLDAVAVLHPAELTAVQLP